MPSPLNPKAPVPATVEMSPCAASARPPPTATRAIRASGATRASRRGAPLRIGPAYGTPGGSATRERGTARAGLRPGQVALAGFDDHVFPFGEVTDGDRAAGDFRKRALAVVLDEPFGAADGGGAVLALGLEAALAVAPEP